MGGCYILFIRLPGNWVVFLLCIDIGIVINKRFNADWFCYIQYCKFF